MNFGLHCWLIFEDFGLLFYSFPSPRVQDKQVVVGFFFEPESQEIKYFFLVDGKLVLSLLCCHVLNFPGILDESISDIDSNFCFWLL